MTNMRYGYLGDTFGISLRYLWDIFRFFWGYLGDYWSICPLVECQMLNVNKVQLLSERTSGVPPVIFLSSSQIYFVFIWKFWMLICRMRDIPGSNFVNFFQHKLCLNQLGIFGSCLGADLYVAQRWHSPTFLVDLFLNPHSTVDQDHSQSLL